MSCCTIYVALSCMFFAGNRGWRKILHWNWTGYFCRLRRIPDNVHALVVVWPGFIMGQRVSYVDMARYFMH